MDRNWMKLNRTSIEYLKGVEEFTAAALEYKLKSGSNICYPCLNCNNMRFPKDVYELKDHLIRRGFVNGYTRWTWHGEECDYGESSSSPVTHTTAPMTHTPIDVDSNARDEDGYDNDRMDDMLENAKDDLSERSHVFESILKASKTELFPGCGKYTTLSAVLLLFNLKTRHNVIDEFFSDMLETSTDMFPDGNTLPSSTYKAKKLMCHMGLGYKKIHACPKDCVLYRNEYADLEIYPRCGLSRYKKQHSSATKKGVPAKILWYLPIIPRFKRLFSDEKNAKLFRWHSEVRKVDGLMRHPADSPQWRTINNKFSEFGNDARNLRLGLSTDGMNPFGTLSSQYSTWPVILTIYNLPPWLCMKCRYMMLSLLISGPKQPGNDIDVYLSPLIEDLKFLRNEGVTVFDACSNSNFTLRAMIFCTINNFPALGNLGGYPIKGKKACPICEDDTDSVRLEYCKKHVYMNHRRFLPSNHSFQRKRKAFRKIELNRAQAPLTGMEVYDRVKDVTTEYGKPYKAKTAGGYKKRSIFWDLPYWAHLDVRHCLDVMHIEKNVCDTIVGALLNIPGKTKDGLNARKDMDSMGQNELGPQQRGMRKYLPPACYTLSKVEKTSFCQSLHQLKVPAGYCSNFRSIVSMSNLKLVGMKSHDCHVLMQQFLPVAIRGILPAQVRHAITRLCQFFHTISSKVIDPKLLQDVQNDVVQTLCCLEIYFPPSFFDIMPHLKVHLVWEITWCGPIFLRYMYHFERMMGILKGMVMNMSRPETSIVQLTVCEEVVSWCSEYIADTKDIGLPKSRHIDQLQGKGTIGGKNITMDSALFCKAESYVLQSLSEVHPYLEEHISILRCANPSKTEAELTHMHDAVFLEWFKERVMSEVVSNPELSPTLKWLAYGCDMIVRSYEGYDINGYSFYTKRQDDKSTMQNSGVLVLALSSEYTSKRNKTLVERRKYFYGFIDNILEFSYANQFKIAILQCQWVDSNTGIKRDEHDFLKLANLNQLGHQEDPFILASQAKQVFYIDDPSDSRLSIIFEGKRCILGIDDVVDEQEYDEQFHEVPSSLFHIPRIDMVPDNNAILTRQDHDEGYYV